MMENGSVEVHMEYPHDPSIWEAQNYLMVIDG